MRIVVDNTAITVVGDDGSLTVVSVADITYPNLRKYIVDEGGRDFAAVKDIIGYKSVIVDIADTAVKIVDSKGSKQDVVKGTLSTARRVLRDGGDAVSVTAFLSRLEKNPSSESRSQLFLWLAGEGFSLTTDGFIVGYKSIAKDGMSHHGGKEDVLVTLADGSTKTYCGRIPHPVGATLRMERALVDGNRTQACSVGLHVGTHAFATSFYGGSDIILVLVDPAHVVSVPSHDSRKMRVSELTVLDKFDSTLEAHKAVVTTVDVAAKADFASRDENSNDAEMFESIVAFEDTPKGNPLFDAVAQAVLDKLKSGSLKRRALHKKFSKARRVLLDDVLDSLVADKSITVDGTEYSLV